MSEWTTNPITLIVPAAYAPLARALCAGIAGASGAGMLTTALSADGDEPATHYISSGKLWTEFAAMLENPQAIYDQAQGSVPLETIEAMLNASVIRADEDPHAVLAEVGLKIIAGEV